MAKRCIRLKELTPNINKIYIPSEEYINSVDGLQKNEVYPIETDSEGRQFSVFGKRDNSEIYILGASTVESIYIRPSMRPHTILERLLLEEGYDYSVFNLGYSGSHTLSIINVIVNKLGNKKGSTLVITLPSNDLSVLSLEGNYFNEHWRYSSLTPALSKNVARISNVDYEPYINNLEIIIDICKILNIELFFTTIVYTGVDDNLKKLNDAIISICKLKSVPIINFEDKFTSQRELFYDKLHFLPNGSKSYAETIFENIKYSLTSSGINVLKRYDIASDTILNENIKWTDFFSVVDYDFLKVIVDSEFGSDTETKQALIAVDCDGTDIPIGFAKSNNSEIGYFSYLTGPKSKRIETSLHIDIPPNCLRIRIGLRSWASKNVKIHNSFLFLVKA